jgi:hypothetical protein
MSSIEGFCFLEEFFILRIFIILILFFSLTFSSFHNKPLSIYMNDDDYSCRSIRLIITNNKVTGYYTEFNVNIGYCKIYDLSGLINSDNELNIICYSNNEEDIKFIGKIINDQLILTFICNDGTLKETIFVKSTIEAYNNKILNFTNKQW